METNLPDLDLETMKTSYHMEVKRSSDTKQCRRAPGFLKNAVPKPLPLFEEMWYVLIMSGIRTNTAYVFGWIIIFCRLDYTLHLWKSSDIPLSICHINVSLKIFAKFLSQIWTNSDQTYMYCTEYFTLYSQSKRTCKKFDFSCRHHNKPEHNRF